MSRKIIITGLAVFFACNNFHGNPRAIYVTAAVLAYAASKGSPLYGFLLLFIYSIGRSIPLILTGTFTGAVKGIQKLEPVKRAAAEIKRWRINCAGAVAVVDQYLIKKRDLLLYSPFGFYYVFLVITS